MAYLTEIIREAGFSHVQTYIQSGNLLLDTDLPVQSTAAVIRQTIREKIGADLSVIIKTNLQLESAVKQNPFADDHDPSRIHLLFTNSTIEQEKLTAVCAIPLYDEEFYAGSECLYMYLPRNAAKKVLNTNFLEKQLHIVATMRKLSVVRHLCGM